MSAGGSRAYQAGSAAEAQPARDPAMEDILASIRRIISDDQRALGLGDIQPSRTASRRPNEEAGRTRPSIDRDLQRLTSIRPRTAEVDEPPEPHGPMRPTLPSREQERAARELDLEDERAVRAADHAAREEELGLRETGRLQRDAGRHGADPRLRYAEPSPQVDYRPQSQAGDRLTSRNVDASVGSAFDALTASIAHRARTMEEVVAEMLRPMLREWLEDNLPDLVEQLVRSEIERVVRGGRRD